MANQVTLTFAGESKPLEDTFDRVGSSAESMGERVGDSAGGFDRAAEAADTGEARAQGFADTLTGTADVAAGTSAIMKGDLFEGFVTLGGGLADLAGGFAEFLIPMLQQSRIATLAKAAADRVAAGAARGWAVANRILGMSILGTPIGWILAGIAALIAIVILIEKRTGFFSKAWRVAWGWIRSAAENTWNWLKRLPGWIGAAFSRVSATIAGPFKAAFNAISNAWNRTVGRLSWTVPGWVPGIGGNSISVPNLPTFHAGGIVPGVPGTAVPIMAQAGERVSSIASSARDGGGYVRLDDSRTADFIVEMVQQGMHRRGGDPRALGIRFA